MASFDRDAALPCAASPIVHLASFKLALGPTCAPHSTTPLVKFGPRCGWTPTRPMASPERTKPVLTSREEDVIESERLLILRDFSGALDAATRHIESPALALFATRERALAVAVQALHELGRGEEAFELVLSTVAGPGGGGKSDTHRYATLADVNLELLKLLFRLRRHLDGSPEQAQAILAPYIAGICRRNRSDTFNRWKRHDTEGEIDTELVELFLLDCVLVVEV